MRRLLVLSFLIIAGCGRSGVPALEEDAREPGLPHVPGPDETPTPEPALLVTDWLSVFGGAGDDAGLAVSAGGARVGLAGSFQQSVDFGAGDETSAGGDDAFVAVLEDGGAYAWHAVAGGSGDEASRAIALHADGRVAAGGRFDSSSIDLGGGAKSGSGDGEGDFFVGAWSADGVPAWSAASQFIGRDEVHALSWTGFLFAGGDEDPTAADTDSFLERRTSADGGVAGGVSHLASTGDEHVIATSSSPSGDRYAGAGFFTGDATYAGTLLTAALEDGIVYHTITAGSVDWFVQIEGTSDSRITALTWTAAGWLVAGTFSGSASARGTDLGTAGDVDVFAMLLADADGAVVWSLRAGGPGDDSAAGIAADANGRVFLATRNATASLLHVIEDGEVVDQAPVGGGSVQVSGLAVGASGELYLGGSFSAETDFGLGPRTPAGGSDAFVLRAHVP